MNLIFSRRTGRLAPVLLLQGTLVLATAHGQAQSQPQTQAQPQSTTSSQATSPAAASTMGSSALPANTGSNAVTTPASLGATPTEVDNIPTNVPKPPAPVAPANPANYVLGPEDQITVHVFGADDISDKPLTIANDGTVSVPMVGAVHAGGKTVSQFEADLNTRFKTYFKDPQVSVSVSDFRSQPVSVAGAVNTPGVVQLRGPRTLVEVISMAGGLRADAGNTVTVTRSLSEGKIPLADAFVDPTGKYSVAHVNLRAVMDAQSPGENILIKKDDVVTVPRAQMVYVIGNVAKSGGFVLNDRESISVLQALALAGGVNATAQTKNARILRAEGGPQRVELHTDVRKIMSGQAPDIPLKADDILFIPNSATKSAAIKGLETAVNVGTGLAIWRF